MAVLLFLRTFFLINQKVWYLLRCYTFVSFSVDLRWFYVQNLTIASRRITFRLQKFTWTNLRAYRNTQLIILLYKDVVLYLGNLAKNRKIVLCKILIWEKLVRFLFSTGKIYISLMIFTRAFYYANRNWANSNWHTNAYIHNIHTHAYIHTYIYTYNFISYPKGLFITNLQIDKITMLCR